MKRLLPTLLIVLFLLSACLGEPAVVPAQVPAQVQTGVASGIGSVETKAVSAQQTALAEATATAQPSYTVVGILDFQPNSFKTLFTEGPDVAVYATNGPGVLEILLGEKIAELEATDRAHTIHIGVNADQYGGEDFALLMREQYPQATIVVWHENPLTKGEDLVFHEITAVERADALSELPYLLKIP